jgi:lipoprotein NlpI
VIPTAFIPGLAYLETENFDASIENFKKAVELDSNNKIISLRWLML